MTPLIVIACVLVYAGVGAFFWCRLSENYTVAKRAGLVGLYSDTDAGIVFGTMFWPLIGVSICIKHQYLWGIKASDRSCLRQESADKIAKAMNEYREERVRELERSAGLR